KTEPPEGLKATGFGTHLSLEWGYPPGVAASYFPLVFELQYQEQGSGEWEQEPDVGEQTSYSVYGMKPDTVYILAVRCKNSDGKGFWSDWSTPVIVSSGQATAQPVQGGIKKLWVPKVCETLPFYSPPAFGKGGLGDDIFTKRNKAASPGSSTLMKPEVDEAAERVGMLE
ncbi:hypothetical protein KIL84_015311, partial [Mauremys mutica]